MQHSYSTAGQGQGSIVFDLRCILSALLWIQWASAETQPQVSRYANIQQLDLPHVA
jgi:hypothetical protein